MAQLIFQNVLPLYGLILLGFVIAKTTALDVQSIATIMLYAIIPVVMFGATGTMDFSSAFLLPPMIVATISIIASSMAYYFASRYWGSSGKKHNLLGLLGVSSNATYFGIPIVISIAGQESVSLYMIMVLPLFILDCTLSYYFGVRSEFTFKDSIKRVAKLPIIYGAIGGLVFNLGGFEFSTLMLDYWDRFTGTVIILGMMMIGAALARMEKMRFDWPFFIGVVVLRYILWPVLGLCWVAVDYYFFGMLDDQVYVFILLICACPLAANAVAYATQLNLYPSLTACMVLLTTLFSLAFIPLMLWVQSVIF